LPEVRGVSSEDLPVKRRCPVCRQIAHSTIKSNIAGHTDRLGRDVCPMTGQPFSLTVITNR
jgi:hypothetical protein